jgi:hypothetical protein
MKPLITAAICLGALYVIDEHWFGGVYFRAIKSMGAQMMQHFF